MVEPKQEIHDSNPSDLGLARWLPYGRAVVQRRRVDWDVRVEIATVLTGARV